MEAASGGEPPAADDDEAGTDGTQPYQPLTCNYMPLTSTKSTLLPPQTRMKRGFMDCDTVVLEHMQKRGLASVVKPEKQNLGILVVKP